MLFIETMLEFFKTYYSLIIAMAVVSQTVLASPPPCQIAFSGGHATAKDFEWQVLSINRKSAEIFAYSPNFSRKVNLEFINLDPGQKDQWNFLLVADGQIVPHFARGMRKENIKNLVLVGIESEEETRAVDYSKDRTNEQFRRHDDFVFGALLEYLKKQTGIEKIRRENLAVMGHSNGAIWSVNSALNHPDIIGGFVTLSSPRKSSDFSGLENMPQDTRMFFGSGNIALERFRFRTNIDDLHAHFHSRGFASHHKQLPISHDFHAWGSTLPNILAHIFPR